ncbi:MAG: hypothetical protein KIT89_05325 [Microcella sp.]|uniref:hypothetical protein n=1 Tax=Microcella sp. TaxID=1913979 RepID=UPI0024CCBED0|nr:hypothetical protein [Microcella sp.]UYN84598.1 MAG: hypothetical protein KIT89_05325 [Microcella sp.]
MTATGVFAGGARATARVWRGIVVTPIREGRVRDTGWPPGLTPVVALGTGAFVFAVALILAAPALRALLPLTATVGASTLSLPRALLPTIFWLVIVALALMQTAALHVHRTVAIVLTAMTVLSVLFIGAIDLGPDGEGGVTVTAGKLISLVVAGGLVALTVLRRRSRFAWWEFPAVLALLGLSAAVALGASSMQSAVFGIDVGPTALSVVMTSIGQLAIPAAIAAGLVVAQVALNASRAVVGVVRRSTGATPRAVPVALVVLLVIVGVWRVVDVVVPSVVAGEPDGELLAALPGSAILLAVVAVGWFVLARRRGDSVGAADELDSAVDRIAIPVAIGLSITIAPIVVMLLIVQVAASWGAPVDLLASGLELAAVLGSAAVATVVRAVVGVSLIVVAVAFVARLPRGAAELLLAIGVIAVSATLPTLLGVTAPWSSDALAVWVALVTGVVVVVLAVRGTLDEERAALLAMALVLSAALAWREVIADPLSIVIGSSGVALVLFGFVWGFATEARATHGDSPRYPRAARVLLFLANAVFGVTVLAFAVLVRNLDVPLNLDDFAQFGDQLLGTALILCAVLAVWAATAPRLGLLSARAS